MCGICGIFDTKARGFSQLGLVRQMSETLTHRGPDGDGFYTSPHCVLGHRRLKIIDLSPLGRQPMCNEDESVWVSFNGEIYNYQELRSELIRHGHQFRSQTDTEVLVHLYEDEGESFLNRINGMFALALWDTRREQLLLARDRFGKKPLYYYADRERLFFGSEMKALLADPSMPRELDPEAFSFYLSLGYIPSPRTIFRGIRKLPAGSWLTVSRDPSSDGLLLKGPQRYWVLRYKPNPRLTETECLERIRETVRDAVRIRMRSDVPLGAFLSGGVDSSGVVATMAKMSERPVETFSIGFDEASYDELHYAELVAKRFNTNHHTFRCEPDALEVLPTLAHNCDEPFADSSLIPTYYVSKIARQYVTVALSGDGGDEVFAGYTRYDNGMMRWHLAQFLPDTLIRRAFRLLTQLYPINSRGWGILYRNSLTPLEGFVAEISLFNPREKQELFSQATRQSQGLPDDLVRHLAEEAGSSEFLTQMQYADQMLYLPDDILVKVDRTSMAVSLEVRAPLLDYRLAEFLATVPAKVRYRNGVKKYLLKKALAAELPSAILHREKMGFGVPLKHWFRKEATDFARDILLSTSARQRGLFQSHKIEQLLQRHSKGRRDFSSRIWALLFFEIWCQTWLDRPQSKCSEYVEATLCPRG